MFYFLGLNIKKFNLFCLSLFFLNIVSFNCIFAANSLKVPIINAAELEKHAPNPNAIKASISKLTDPISLLRELINNLTYQNFLKAVIFLSKILAIVIVYWLLWRLTNIFTNAITVRLQSRYVQSLNQSELQPLLLTIGPIIKSLWHWCLTIIFSLIFLTECGIDITPIIYSFGVLGLAISFGAQTLVKDIITGILTLFEGVLTVGEVVEINGNIGNVEALSLRTIKFRHGTGQLEVIPFSQVNSLNNLSRQFKECVITLTVPIAVNYEEIAEAITNVYHGMLASTDYKAKFLTPLEFKGLTNLSVNSYEILASFNTIPDPYDLIANEFRRRLLTILKNQILFSPASAPNLISNSAPSLISTNKDANLPNAPALPITTA